MKRFERLERFNPYLYALCPMPDTGSGLRQAQDFVTQQR